MQSILSTHLRPEASGPSIRLNLTVVRLASGLPGLVRASPALFHKLGSFAGVRSTTKVRLLGFGLAFRNRFGSVFLRLFHVDFARHRCRRRHCLHCSLPLSCAKFNLSYTSLDSLCAGQVKLSIVRFNQILII